MRFVTVTDSIGLHAHSAGCKIGTVYLCMPHSVGVGASDMELAWLDMAFDIFSTVFQKIEIVTDEQHLRIRASCV